MNYSVYLRPLVLDDAKTSYNWRNDSEIWKYTGSRPDRHITYEIEKEWLQKALDRSSERRFAICLKKNDRYIGNIQLVDIHAASACFHLFIGEKQYWGKGIAKTASSLILHYAFSELDIQMVTLEVHKENYPAQSVYRNMGFVETAARGKFLVMVLNRDCFGVVSER